MHSSERKFFSFLLPVIVSVGMLTSRGEQKQVPWPPRETPPAELISDPIEQEIQVTRSAERLYACEPNTLMKFPSYVFIDGAWFESVESRLVVVAPSQSLPEVTFLQFSMTAQGDINPDDVVGIAIDAPPEDNMQNRYRIVTDGGKHIDFLVVNCEGQLYYKLNVGQEVINEA